MRPDAAAQAFGHSTAVVKRKQSGASKSLHTWARMELLGLANLASLPDAEWRDAPSATEASLVRQLRAKVEQKVRDAVDPETLGTALGYVESFARATPGRPLFMHPSLGQPALVYNAETMALLHEFITSRGSVRPGQLGKTLAVDTVSSYCGAFKSAVEAMAHCRVVPSGADDGGRQKRVGKREKKTAAPKSRDRQLRRLGFRARYFEPVTRSGFDWRSELGAFRWTVWLLTWACLMRPGEPGWGRGSKPWDPQRGLCICHLVFWSPDLNTNNDGRWAVCVMILPIKDQTGEATRRPTVISARHPGGEPSGDPRCVYSYALRLHRRRVAETCQQIPQCCGPTYCAACQAAPLCAWPRSLVPWSTDDGSAVVKDMATAIGLDAAEYAGASGRIAGATDIKDAMGATRGAAVVHQRGRWSGDMEEIYARDTAAEQMEASLAMADATRPEFESLLPGWVQPTRGWSRRSR